MASADRREILKLAAAVPFGAALIHSSLAHAAAGSGIRGQQGKKITLKFGSSQPTHTENAHTVFFDAFLAEMTKRTNGDVGAIFYGDSQLGPENKYSNQINSGTLDMMMTVSDWTPIVTELGVLTMGCSAALIDSLTVRNFPSLTDEMEYLTTKNAKRSVMKSA